MVEIEEVVDDDVEGVVWFDSVVVDVGIEVAVVDRTV